MREVLGINAAGIEVILRLRRQVIDVADPHAAVGGRACHVGGWPEHTSDAAS